MRGNNKGRIFMSLINHILRLFPRCLHPSCLASLPPPYFRSHSLYHFTHPSVKRRKRRERNTTGGGGGGKRDKVFLSIYLVDCVSIMLFYDGPFRLTYSHKELNLHCGLSKSTFRSKTKDSLSTSTNQNLPRPL